MKQEPIFFTMVFGLIVSSLYVAIGWVQYGRINRIKKRQDLNDQEHAEIDKKHSDLDKRISDQEGINKLLTLNDHLKHRA